MKVLVISVRGLQAGALAPYGNPWIDTPFIEALAAEGILFDQHLADAADPLGARHAWRTGRNDLPPFPPPNASLPSWDLIEALTAQNIFTFLIVDQSRPGLTDFEPDWNEVAHAEADDEGTALEVSIDVARAALADLASHPSWLLWIDLAPTLPPWETPEDFQLPYFQEEQADDEESDEKNEDAPADDQDVAVDDDGDEPQAEIAEVPDPKDPEEEEAEEPLFPVTDPPVGPIDPFDDNLFLRIQTTYAGAVSYLDAAVGELMEVLREAGVDEETLVILTGDVGAALGEHGVVGPGSALLHEEVLHIPLIVRLPGLAEAGRRVPSLTQAIDLAPTLAEAFGLTTPPLPGHSLWPLMRGQVEKVRSHAISGVQVGPESGWALRTPEWALLLVENGDPEQTKHLLFVKPDDRCEVNDVRHHHMEVAEGLEKELDGIAQPAEN